MVFDEMNRKIKKILKKKNKSKIICLTAYSKNIAAEVDKYTDITLVGDSLGSVLYNYNSTRDVTLTEMINHSKSVRLAVKKANKMAVIKKKRVIRTKFDEILVAIDF